MGKVNYVIATWSGKNTKRTSTNIIPLPELQLRVHLEHLHKMEHNLDQITIMKPECPTGQAYKKYYAYKDIKFACPIVEVPCLNYGYSNGQWMRAYEKYGADFDYYICVEDDYCPKVDYFDRILVDEYNKNFPNGIGKLCGFIKGHPYNPTDTLPLHWSNLIFISSKAFKTIYECKLWLGDPMKYLDYTNMLSLELDLFKDNTIYQKHLDQKWKSYPGAVYQVLFSVICTQSGVELKAMTNFDWPFFNGKLIIYLLDKKCLPPLTKSSRIFRLNDRKNVLFMPIQMCLEYKLQYFKCEQIAVLLVGNEIARYKANVSITKFNTKVLEKNTDKDDYVDELVILIKQEYNGMRYFFIKDSRIALLYKLYLEALNKLNILIKVIYISGDEMPYFEQVNGLMQTVESIIVAPSETDKIDKFLNM